MKVLHITTNYPTPKFPVFGIFVKEQVESLEKEGVQCDVFFSNGKEKGGIKEHRLSILRMWNLLRKNHYDVIHCHHSISGLILLLCGGAFLNKCVLSYQNDPTREFGGKWLFYIFYLFFNRIIVKNKSKYLHKRKVVYLPNGTNSDFFRPMDKISCRQQLGWDIDKLYVLYMDSNAGTRTQKRHDRYVECLELLKSEFDNIISVELTNTPREQIPIYMNACNLHLMTSDFEGSPNSVKECMCCNTPVVSTDVGNVRDMIGDIPGCYVTETKDPKELAACVKKVLNRNEEFNGRHLFLDKGYGIAEVARKLKNQYEEIIKQ